MNTAPLTTPLSVARHDMLSHQLLDRGIRDPRVLRAIANVPRERFVLPEYHEQAYSDRALPIECQQTISQPYIVGLMTQALDLSGNEHVLEIGTGSGYQAAILAELAHDVVTIERHAELARQAEDRILALGYRNVTFINGDGSIGHAAQAPYDRILVTAAPATCPPALFEQLREGGLLVIPIGPPGDQVLEAIRKIDGQPEVEYLTNCRFVPLVGAAGSAEEESPM